MSQPMIVLPSYESSEFDLYFIYPPGIQSHAVDMANAIIESVNTEDRLNADGVCNDGLSVEENIVRRLEELGFTQLIETKTNDWDR